MRGLRTHENKESISNASREDQSREEKAGGQSGLAIQTLNLKLKEIMKLYAKRPFVQGRKRELLEESTPADVLADVRELLNEYPWLRYRGPETAQRMLRMTRQVRVSEFDVAVALEALRVEGEVLP